MNEKTNRFLLVVSGCIESIIGLMIVINDIKRVMVKLKGFTQVEGLDYSDTFSHAAKLTVKLLLTSVAA